MFPISYFPGPPYVVGRDIEIFYVSCGYKAIQAQLAAILGLHHNGSTISIASIASFAANSNTVAAYQQFCKDLTHIGVTEDTIEQKGIEILDALKSQEMAAKITKDQGK